LVFTPGTVVVAIRISLALKCLNYSRGAELVTERIEYLAAKPLPIRCPPGG
jgi:hypothetical protein